MGKYEQSLEESQKRYSKKEPIILEPNHNTKPGIKWHLVQFRDGMHKFPEYTGEDKEIPDEWTTELYGPARKNGLLIVKANQCVWCGSPYKPYTEKYFQHVYDCNEWTDYEYSAVNHYCRECAIEKAKPCVKNNWNPAFCLVHEYEKVKDDQNCSVQVFADGSVLEEMSNAEKAKKNL